MCYSPKQRPTLQQAFEKKSPIKIIGTRKLTKRPCSDKEEYTLSKSAKLHSTSLAFPYNDKFDNKLHTCEEALEAPIYQRIDLKIKVITKQADKSAAVRKEKTKTFDTLASQLLTTRIFQLLWLLTLLTLLTTRVFQLQTYIYDYLNGHASGVIIAFPLNREPESFLIPLNNVFLVHNY